MDQTSLRKCIYSLARAFLLKILKICHKATSTFLSFESLVCYTILPDYSQLAGEKKIGKICTYTVFQSNEGSVEFCKCTDSSQLSLLTFNKTKIRQNRKPLFLSDYQPKHAPASLCQCTDSPEPSLLKMRF